LHGAFLFNILGIESRTKNGAEKMGPFLGEKYVHEEPTPHIA
jgi:hypothetical protein